MGPRHLLVHVDGSARADERLALAVALAERSGALLTGLFAEGPSLGPSIVARRHPDDVARALADARARFEDRTAAAGVAHEWWEVQGEHAHVVGWTATCCRYVDVAVFGQQEEEDRLPGEALEHVVLESGRPVLVVPSIGHYGDVGRRVVVAWTGSRESARAVNDALPLLQPGAEVTVLAFQEPSVGSGGGPVPPVDVAAHLRAHGVAARYEPVIVGPDIGVVDLVLNRASDLGADLTVIGYGRRAGPFLRLSQASREALRTMTTPVLVSH